MLLIGIFISSVTEIIGVAAIIPLLAAVLKSELITQNQLFYNLEA